KLKNKDKKTLFNVFDLQVTEDLLGMLSKQLKNDWLKIGPVGWVDAILDDEKNDVKGVEKHLILIDAKGCEIGLTSLPLIISDLDGRVNIEDGYLSSRKFNGTCSGGSVNGSVELDTASRDGEYSGKLNINNISLQKLMENFVTDHQKWTGNCNGDFVFQGKGNDLMNLTAKGTAKVRDGYLSEVPAVLSILKLLNMSLPKKEAFHTANIKYSIKDKIINIEALEVISDSVELGCIGTVGFDSTIDLIVVAGFNKETFSQIPFIGGLMDFVVGGVRKSLTKVQLTGKLSNPQSTMIGLKPFTYPITSIIDVISNTKTKEDVVEEENDEYENKEEGTD
ncbi:MAG: AsmA family protein, partial [Candidatus Brocadiaceae bacterium]|nr:AsmA family protein [Candidatus Brocadiaceae bacterium]